MFVFLGSAVGVLSDVAEGVKPIEKKVSIGVLFIVKQYRKMKKCEATIQNNLDSAHLYGI